MKSKIQKKIWRENSKFYLHNIHLLSVQVADWIHNQNIRLIRNPNSNLEPEVDDWIHNQNILLEIYVEFVWSNRNPRHILRFTKQIHKNNLEIIRHFLHWKI